MSISHITRKFFSVKRITCIILSIVLLTANFVSLNIPLKTTAASPFDFKGSMSEQVLNNYLSRAVTVQGLCGEGADDNFLFEEDLRMIRRTGAKYISRAALFAWTSTSSYQVEKHYNYAKRMATEVHKADSEIILEAFVAEIVRKSYVNSIAIPDWVFEAFGKTPENRNFRFDDIIDKELGVNYWGKDAGYPDYSNEEALMWYYYCVRRYIDAGYEAIHIQEGRDKSEYANVDKLLTMCRNYAKTNARRGIVLFHNFFDIIIGGNKIGNRLLFDINGNGLVPSETVAEDGALKCRIGTLHDYWLTWIGRSAGGEHPLGFTTDVCPTLLEFDNYGQQGELGVSNGIDFGTWGYDDISWFATQPEWYRNEFLLYVDEFLKTHCLNKAGKQAYYCLYPMRRVITASPNWPTTTYTPGEYASTDFLLDYCSDKRESISMEFVASGKVKLTTKEFYRANRQSDGCPNGFNQEDTIRKIFLGENAAEDPDLPEVVLPSNYTSTANYVKEYSVYAKENSHISDEKVISDIAKVNQGYMIDIWEAYRPAGEPLDKAHLELDYGAYVVMELEVDENASSLKLKNLDFDSATGIKFELSADNKNFYTIVDSPNGIENALLETTLEPQYCETRATNASVLSKATVRNGKKIVYLKISTYSGYGRVRIKCFDVATTRNADIPVDGHVSNAPATCVNAEYCIICFMQIEDVNLSKHAGIPAYAGVSYAHTRYNCCGLVTSTKHMYDVNTWEVCVEPNCNVTQKNYARCICGYSPKDPAYLIDTGILEENDHTGFTVYGGTANAHFKYNCCNAPASATHKYELNSGEVYIEGNCTTPQKNFLKCICGYNPRSSSCVVDVGVVESNHKSETVAIENKQQITQEVYYYEELVYCADCNKEISRDGLVVTLGDCNVDEKFDILDLIAIKKVVLDKGYSVGGDMNQDDVINSLDLTAIKKNLFETF